MKKELQEQIDYLLTTMKTELPETQTKTYKSR